MNPLDNLEHLTQRFVEGTFHHFFGKKLHTVDLVDKLLASIEARHNGYDTNLLPASYQLTVNPIDYAALAGQNSIEGITSELVAYLTTFAGEASYQFDGSLRIVLKEDELVQPGHIEISIPVETVDGGGP